MITIAQIQDAVAGYYGIAVSELIGTARDQRATARRAVAYQLCNELLAASYLSIGNAFGRDHTTVIRALARPLGHGDEFAFDHIRTQLVGQRQESPEVIRRWPFRSRRKPLERVEAVFLRRYTA